MTVTGSVEAVDRSLPLWDLVDDRTLEILERRRAHAPLRRRRWLVKRVLVAADGIGLALALIATHILVGLAAAPALALLISLPAYIGLARPFGLYERDEDRINHSTVDELVGVFNVLTIGTWAVFIGTWLLDFPGPGPSQLITFWGLAIGAVTLMRAAGRAICRRQIAYLQNTVIIGAGEVGQLVARKVLRHPEYGLNLVGFVDDEPRERSEGLGHLAQLGSLGELPEVVRLLDVERVVVAFSNASDVETRDVVRSLQRLNVQVDIVPRLFETLGATACAHALEGLPLVGLPPAGLPRSSRTVKRAFDLVVACAALLVLSPMLLLIALLIRLDSPGPVFFRQVRMGAERRTFRIFKFRTMAVDAEERKAAVAHLNKHAWNGGDPRMFKIPEDPRVTRIGCLLRRYSLDELPQLINVLKGEMSLVGPRPIILDEDQHVHPWAQRRNDLKPGITGPWQVMGRSEIPFEEMLRLDYAYVTGWSFARDLKLIIQTLPVLYRAPDPY